MQLKRVVITGAGVVSPFGQGKDILMDNLRANKSAIKEIPALAGIRGLTTRVGGAVPAMDFSIIPRKDRRSMSAASMYAFLAAQEALTQAGIPPELLKSGRTGIAAGSTIASVATLEEFFTAYLKEHNTEGIKSMLFFRIMGHSVAANLAQSLGVTGRVLSPAAACSTSLQALGIGYETIAHGLQDAMLCGGADELHPLTSATFDTIGAASAQYNDSPTKTPRPFDKDRDGIVCAEGAAMILLEGLETALARKASILAEVIAFATTTDPSSIANPSPEAVQTCMALALKQGGLRPEQIDYVNAHATGTIQGDAAEAQGIANLFGAHHPPVSSLKGYLGHTMAASGAMELTACLEMMRDEFIFGTKNLEMPSKDCQCAHLLQSNVRRPIRHVLKNSFALGGINCTLIIRIYND